MKLSEIRKLSQNHSITNPHADPRTLHDKLHQMSIDPSSFYQELEMDSPYVDTHRSVSYSNVQFHSHAFYELICCRNTCGAEYLVGTDRYRLQKGDIIFVPPDVSHRPLLPQSVTEPYSRDVLWISEPFMASVMPLFPQELRDTFAEAGLFRTAETRWDYICELFRRGVLEAESAEACWESAVIANTLSILTHLCRARADSHTRPLTAETPELLDQVLAYVELHFSEKITLADIARHFFVSESTVTQTFRRKMNVSFYRCVTQRRLISAKALIERGLPLEAVAEQVGFSDYSSFFRAFKQEYGISPRQYRRMQNSPEHK